MKPAALIILLFVYATPIYAQANFGIRLGGNFAIWSSSDAEDLFDADFSTLTAGHFGPYVHIPISKKLALEPALLGSIKGTNVNLFETEMQGGDVITFESDADIYLLYLDIPVLLRFYLVDGLNIYAGPQVSFLLYNVVDNQFIECFNNMCFEDDEEDEAEVTNTDFALSFGLGYDFDFGLNLNVGYDLGLSSIDDTGEPVEVNNRVIEVSVGWTFGK